ncbi:MAG: GGDEF domain-containing protein [Oscillospiraceae bacterium]|nr:GGDEF domain-containing protein [Oscillospiraceae bacterium]
MASLKKKQGSSYKGGGFVIAAVALFLVLTINSLMLLITYQKTSSIFTTTSKEMNLINSANGQLVAANTEVLEIVAGIGNMDGHINAITAMFEGIREKLDNYEKIEGHDEMALRRFRYARAFIEAYDEKLLTYQIRLNASRNSRDEEADKFLAQIPYIYQEEIAPLQLNASEMMVASISIGAASANKRTAESIRFVYFIVSILAVVLVLGEIAILLVARYTRRSIDEIDRKNAQFAEASSKLMRSREKMEDISTLNILTGLKNRYALEQDIGSRLADSQFNIAVFDLDGFRQINDMYGYDFGDEYLSQIAERLRNEFGAFCDLYNIAGNEFCAVFNREVSDTQAIHYVEGICNAMASPYTIFNLTVQLTVSASTYHYVAGDCLNLNSLLVKMDGALRYVKRQGGGRIQEVMNI